MTAVRATPASGVALGSIYRMFLRGQLTRLRAVGLLLLSVVAIILAFHARTDDAPVRTATEIMAEYGLTVVVPVCTLWIASSLVGELIEDRLMAYLWLKPIPKWIVPAAALAATVTIMVPLVVIPLTIAASISGDGPLITATVIASLLGVTAYGGLFVMLGVRFSRALWWGLAYVLVWENAVARLTDGTAQVSVRSYLASIVSRLTDVDLSLADRSAAASYIVPIAISIVAVALAAVFLQRRDVD